MGLGGGGEREGAAAGFGIPQPVVDTCCPIERHKSDRDVRMQACVQVALACEDVLASGLPLLSPRPCPSLPSHRRQRRQQHIPCMSKVQNMHFGEPPPSKVFRQTLMATRDEWHRSERGACVKTRGAQVRRGVRRNLCVWPPGK